MTPDGPNRFGGRRQHEFGLVLASRMHDTGAINEKDATKQRKDQRDVGPDGTVSTDTHAIVGNSRCAGLWRRQRRVVVVRAPAGMVEPALQLLKAVRRAWRPLLWAVDGADPRGWAV